MLLIATAVSAPGPHRTMFLPWFSRTPATRMRHASVQTAHMRIEAISEEAVHLHGNHYLAILEAGGINFALADEAEQEAFIAGLMVLFNSLSYAVQLVVDVQQVDLEPHLAGLEARSRELLPELAALARDHAAFVRKLERTRTLLERRAYLVVTLDDAPHGHHPLLPWRRGRAAPVQPDAVHKRLTDRCEELTRQLSRCGISARRLRDQELALLYYRCWCHDAFQRKRVLVEVGDFVQLVIRGKHPRETPRAAPVGAVTDATR